MTWQRGTHPSLLGNATLQVVKEEEEDGTVVKEVVKSFPLLGEEPLGEKPVNALAGCSHAADCSHGGLFSVRGEL